MLMFAFFAPFFHSTFWRKCSAWGVVLLIVLLYGFSFWVLANFSEERSFWQFNDSLQLIKISLFQALLSALGATLFGLLCARSFFYLHFPAKPILLKLFSLAWALPSLVVIFAIIGVWGNHGWLGRFLPSFYGLTGILLAHLFLNIPLATKYTLSSLHLISINQLKLADQFNFNQWQRFRWVELPLLKQSLPHTFGTIFLLCFTSFPIVLMLGGGPKYSTLETAIYQAISFEFDFHKAIQLILLQTGLGIFFHLCLQLFPKQHNVVKTHTTYQSKLGLNQKIKLYGILLMGLAFISLPLLNIIVQAVQIHGFFAKLTAPILWQAIGYSFGLAVISAITSLLLSYLLALENRHLAQQKSWQFKLFSIITILPLLLPTFLLAVGLFVWFMESNLSHFQLLLIVGFCNGLIMIPYIYPLIYPALHSSLHRYQKLSQSLGLTGWNNWYIAEKKWLIQPLTNAFALAMSASLGSFSVIAFFGTHEFHSLPYLLYRQLGSYQTEEAAITAFVLLIATLLPFLLFEIKEPQND